MKKLQSASTTKARSPTNRRLELVLKVKASKHVPRHLMKTLDQIR